MCGHKPQNKDFYDSDDTIYKGNQEPSIPSIEKTFQDIANQGLHNQQNDQALDEAMKKAKEN